MVKSNEASPFNHSQRRIVHRWRFTIVLALVALAIPGVLGIYMGVSGHGPRTTVENWFDELIAIVYFGGSILAFLFGDLLAHPDDPIHKWNAFLFYAGGLLSWTLLGAFVGFLVDLSRRPTPHAR